jgi:hypothetical protein
MHWRSCTRSTAIGGILLAATLATGALIAPAHAQMQQVDGFGAYAPQWALGNPYMFSGLNAGSSMATGINQQAYTAPLGSGTVGLFVESNGGAGAIGSGGNLFGPLSASPTSLRDDWSANLGNSAWRTSVFGSYKSAPNTELFNCLYTTAGFGVTSIKASPPGLPGLSNFTAGNDVVGVTARAGVGLQLTPQISVEGSFSWTQVPGSALR